MHNYFTVETEAEFRRQEWQRAVAAEARVALVGTGKTRPPWPPLAVMRVRAFLAPRLPVFAPWVPRRCSVACGS
jgi:hypothetical protein